jgi:hypothetical protein
MKEQVGLWIQVKTTIKFVMIVRTYFQHDNYKGEKREKREKREKLVN